MKRFLKDNKTLLLLALVALIMAKFVPFFATRDNLLNILKQSSIYGIMACGMTFAIIGGDFDLSIGSTLALSGLICVLLEPVLGQGFAIVLALIAAVLVGLINAVLIARFKINAFIATIGTMNIFKGVALRISGGEPIASSNPNFSRLGNGVVLGIPNIILVMVVCILISAYVLARTRYGRNVYAIGGNMEVAHNSGVNATFIKGSIFALSALTAGLAGILNASRLNTASAIQGDSISLNVITGVVIGGTSLVGGTGGIGKSIVGIWIFSVINNALDLLGVYSYYQMIIRGAMLVAIMCTEAYSRNKTEQMSWQRGGV